MQYDILNILFKTGPKGVIKDWQRYKQLENEKNIEAQEERRRIMKRLAMTCRSSDLDKELEKEGVSSNNTEASANNPQNLDDEDDIMHDEFFKEYIKKKYEEMQSRSMSL